MQNMISLRQEHALIFVLYFVLFCVLSLETVLTNNPFALAPSVALTSKVKNA